MAYKITMLDFIRGEEAWAIIDEETAIQPPPEENEEYLLVEFKIHAIEVSEEPFRIRGFDFEVADETGSVYKKVVVV